MLKFSLSLLLLFACGFLTVSAQSADPFLSRHKERQAQNPDGLSFTIKLKDNQKQFHLGEIITVELSFAASKPDTLTLDAATYDRSGRLHSDGFALDPQDGAVDPIGDYFSAQLNAFFMGGLRGIPDLTDKPYVITDELNEWQRIDKAGHYRLYVVSSRVGRKASGNGVLLQNGYSPAISNVIEFDILPADKKWATEKLSEAISVLSKSEGSHNPACRTLRFLGTTAAATEMRKRFDGSDNKCEWEYKFGLIGSPHRDFVIRDMENAISLREQPITAHFIRTLALLEFIKRGPGLPSLPDGATEEQRAQYSSQLERRRNFYDELSLNYVRQLMMVIPLKQGYARAASLQTVLDFRTELNTAGSSQWSTLLSLLPEVFKRLPFDEQCQLLTYEWKPIASAAMLPVLREVLKYSYSTKEDSELGGFNFFRQEELRSIALRRLYELSPEEGRRLIFEEIRRPSLRVGIDVLRSLPDKTLPELNTVLLDKLAKARREESWDTGNEAELIERYATDEILMQVKAVYEAGGLNDPNCSTQPALVAYFLRVAPSLGGEYLNKALSMRSTGFPLCYEKLLKGVADLHMSAEVEEAATAALDDENSEVVSQAASVLADYGSADAEKALWKRFEKWHEAMESRSEPEKELTVEDKKIEKALREALSSGQAWFSDPEKLKRVRDLCLSDKERQQVDGMISNWEPQIYINTTYPFGDETPRFGVANREIKSLDLLKDKLLQFPGGTLFKLKIAPRGDDKTAQELVQQIQTFLEEQGMKWKPEP